MKPLKSEHMKGTGMKFQLSIVCDNAAFGDTYEEAAEEVSRVLTVVCNKLARGVYGSLCLDANGNWIGDFELTKE